jgi:hypothetical protein
MTSSDCISISRKCRRSSSGVDTFTTPREKALSGSLSTHGRPICFSTSSMLSSCTTMLFGLGIPRMAKSSVW